MIYIYDKIICKDLEKSFNPINSDNPVVRVIDTEAIIGLAAQIKNDEITFPVVAIQRQDNTPIDWNRMNFTRLHEGVATVFDNVKNEFYYEKAIPIDLKYDITVLTTNVADMDELLRELLFKYSDMYFLSMRLPYESDRKIRFGLTIDSDTNIERSSGSSQYITGGTLHQSIIHLKVDGAVLLSYTPVKLRRTTYDVVAATRKQLEDANLI